MKSLIILPYVFLVGLLVVALLAYLLLSVVLMVIAIWRGRKSNSIAVDDKNRGPSNVRIVPKHVAVIMDGNRRYGKEHFGSAHKGHHAGGQTLSNFVDWCIEEGISALTCYAFSTENWKRSKEEVACLMSLFHQHCKQIMKDSLEKNIRVRILSSDAQSIPADLELLFREMEEKTRHCDGFYLQLAVSYGSRSEITNACRTIAQQVKDGELSIDNITEDLISNTLLTGTLPPIDLMLRTSEIRLSNFLLWQLAYSELVFFPNKNWPAVTRADLQDAIMVYSKRQRRFGK